MIIFVSLNRLSINFNNSDMVGIFLMGKEEAFFMTISLSTLRMKCTAMPPKMSGKEPDVIVTNTQILECIRGSYKVYEHCSAEKAARSLQVLP